MTERDKMLAWLLYNPSDQEPMVGGNPAKPIKQV